MIRVMNGLAKKPWRAMLLAECLEIGVLILHGDAGNRERETGGPDSPDESDAPVLAHALGATHGGECASCCADDAGVGDVLADRSH